MAASRTPRAGGPVALPPSPTNRCRLLLGAATRRGRRVSQGGNRMATRNAAARLLVVATFAGLGPRVAPNPDRARAGRTARVPGGR
jgi:hypothetical protein